MRIESLEQQLEIQDRIEHVSLPDVPERRTWVENASLFWEHRRIFLRVAAVVFLLSIVMVLGLPKEYVSSARIMPPEQGSNGAALIAALAGKSAGGGLAGLAGSLLGA